MTERPGFLFVTCQVGAELAAKAELARRWPDFRFAYSQPGFLTFKLPAKHALVDDFDLGSVFARSYGFSLGRACGDDADALGRDVWRLYGDRPVHGIHVWPRIPPASSRDDVDLPPSAAVTEAMAAIRRQCPRLEKLADDASNPARQSEFILDCVIVDPGQWWVGYHQVRSVPSAWPGGIIPLSIPSGIASDIISRAWLKIEEALRWAELPIPARARFAELGSAPGGSSQALLGHGFEVLGIDPAAMHPTVLGHSRFRHIRCRATAVRRRDLRKVRWLTADMNVAPDETLDAIESIITHPQVHIRGMLVTLKLAEWKLAEQLPKHLRRIRAWGYNEVRARQLFHHRHEVCVAALQRPFVRKYSRR